MDDRELALFWRDDDLAHQDNCFNPEAPQIALGIRMGDQCVFDELEVEGDPWKPLPPEQRLELNRRYNDKAERLVGRRLLQEDPTRPVERCMGKRLTNLPAMSSQEVLPPIRRIGEVFGGRYHYQPHSGLWLSGDLTTTQALEKALDRVDKMDLRAFLLPPDWEAEKRRVWERYGRRLGQLRHLRGPVTLATGLMGVEAFVFLYYDAPELFQRFRETVERVIIGMGRVMDEEAGFDPRTAPGGFSFADDDMSLLTPEMVEAFAVPTMRAVLDAFCPKPEDQRYLHADSDVERVLPCLTPLALTVCNLAPSVPMEKIRRYLPRARIDGCLHPMTFLSGDAEAIRAAVRKDCKTAKEHGIRGLCLDTAGVINPGSTLASMRVVMDALREFGSKLDG